MFQKNMYRSLKANSYRKGWMSNEATGEWKYILMALPMCLSRLSVYLHTIEICK